MIEPWMLKSAAVIVAMLAFVLLLAAATGLFVEAGEGDD